MIEGDLVRDLKLECMWESLWDLVNVQIEWVLYIVCMVGVMERFRFCLEVST